MNDKRWKKTKDNYVFDRYIFKGCILLVFVYCLIVCVSMDFNFGTNFYVKCDSDMGCRNPFYVSDDGVVNPLETMPTKYKTLCVWDWCDEELIPSGFEFGKKPSALFNWAWVVCSVIVAFSFVLNHYWHNKGKKIKWLELEED